MYTEDANGIFLVETNIGRRLRSLTKLSPEEKEILATKNYKLIYSVAHEFKGSVPFDEIESAALVGFAKALDSFDKEKSKVTKAKFATYAMRCIRNEVISFLRKENKRMNNETYAEQAYVYNSDSKDSLQVETITKKDLEYKIEDDLIKNEQLEVILDVFKKLTQQEQFILIHRFGLFNHEIKTQKEIADILNVSQASISKSQYRIEQKLKKFAHKEYNIKSYKKELKMYNDINPEGGSL